MTYDLLTRPQHTQVRSCRLVVARSNCSRIQVESYIVTTASAASHRSRPSKNSPKLVRNVLSYPADKPTKANKEHVLTTGVNSRRPIKRPPEPSVPTVRKRFFRDNFVIFRHRSKRIAFLESVNFSTCGYVQIFNFRDGHVTTFRNPSGAYICQMPGHRLSRSVELWQYTRAKNLFLSKN